MPSDNDETGATRPIDAPLPPWTGRPDDLPDPAQLDRGRNGDDEETPTLTNEDLPSPAGAVSAETTDWVKDSAPTEDPRAMARRLAEEAKRRIREKAAAAAAPASGALAAAAPAPGALASVAPPPVADPAAPLAPTAAAPVAAAEDPRAMAKRLAEEAKERMGITQPPTAAPAPKARPVAAAPPAAQPPKPLARRAARGGGLSAADALKAARARERTPPPTPRTAKPAPRTTASSRSPVDTAQPTASPVAAPAARSAPPAAAAPPSTPATLPDPSAAILSLVPGAAVEPPVHMRSPEVFRALWRTHRTRAQHEGNVPLAATASVLLEAVNRLPAGHLVAARITVGDQVWAVWADIGGQVLLGAAQPADIYLAGL